MFKKENKNQNHQRDAQSIFAAEIARLKNRIAELERENLQFRKIKAVHEAVVSLQVKLHAPDEFERLMAKEVRWSPALQDFETDTSPSVRLHVEKYLLQHPYWIAE